MATDSAAERAARRSGAGWSRTFGLLNPLRAVWWLFTNVRFAIILLAVLTGVSLMGVLLPQKPLAVRGDVVLEAGWLDRQNERFGALTDPLDRAGLFDVFHAGWFGGLMAITVVSTGAYVISRFPGIWRAIAKPRKRVPDRYFQMAPSRVDVATGVDPALFERVLRSARYEVERFEEADGTYLFADRFPLAQLGTLLTHVAVIVFILSAVVSRVDAFSSTLFLAEGGTLPVFPVSNPNQIQVELLDSRGTFAADGQPLDYRSDLVIYLRGEEIQRCSSTVNSPCSYNGYRLHQSAYFGFGAALQVRDLANGNAIYHETLALSETSPSPHVVIKDADGRAVFDAGLVLTDVLSGEDFAYAGTLLTLPDGRILTAGLRTPAGGGEPKLAVLEASAAGREPTQLSLREGQTGTSGGLEVSYLALGSIPSSLVEDLPMPDGAAIADTALLQMNNVVYGTARASEGSVGTGLPLSGPPTLTVSGLGPRAAVLREGESVTVADYEYTFLGQREFSGITVRRDRSDYLVWVGAAAIVLGLMITFWVPRRRLWAKITATRILLAGQAASHADFPREMRDMLRRSGADVAEDTGDYD